MAKKRRSTRNMPAGLRAYWNKKQKKHKTHKRKGHAVAKKKRRSSRKGRRRSSGRRRHSGGSGSIFPALGLPNKTEAMSIAGGAVYGYLEAKAKADPEHMMNKIPRPVEQIGYAGGTALAAYLLHKYAFKHPMLKAFANGTATVAMYQMGKQGEMFKGTPAIQGLDPTYGVEGDDDDIGADVDDLGAEGDDIGDDDIGDDSSEGLPEL